MQRAFECGDRGFDALQCPVIGGTKSSTGVRTQGCDDKDFVANRIENHHDSRAQHDRVGHADRIRLCLGKALHLADHVVAEIAEDARRHRRKFIGRVDPRLRDQLAKCRERRLGARREFVGIFERAAIDLGPPAMDAPDDIRIEANHRVAAPRGAAFDRFEQEDAPGPAGRQFQKGRNGRFKIANETGGDEAGSPRLVAAGADLNRRLEHRPLLKARPERYPSRRQTPLHSSSRQYRFQAWRDIARRYPR